MHGAFCDQSWPGNDAGDDPGLFRTVEWRYAAHAARTVRLPDVLLCRAFVCNSRIYFVGIQPRMKKFGKVRHKMLQFVKFP